MAVNNSLAKKPAKMGLTAYLSQDAVKKQINSIVGGKNGTRFISSIVSAVQTTPALQECTNPSILSAALLGEALNLSPSPQLGQFYMVPFDNKKKGCKEAQFQLGYKGYIQLAKRSGVYKKINVISIKEGELISYNPLEEELEVNLIEDDYERENTPTIGYYAMFEEVNGYRHSIYWSKQKMLAHAEKYSFAFYKNGGAKSLELLEQGKIPEKDLWKYSSFWFKDFDGMAHKTMLRQFQKTLNLLLTAEIDNEEWKPVLESLGVECTLESALLMAQIKAALSGDTQAAKFVAQYSGQSNRTEEDLENKKAETELIKARKESITGENENNDALDRLDQILKEVRDNAFKQETE